MEGALGEAAAQRGDWGWEAKEVPVALAGDWAGGWGAEQGDEGVGMGTAATDVEMGVAEMAAAVKTLVVHLRR